jgi:hypothetical protein
MIGGKFDFVVGNPPWIRWGYLSQEYRKATLPLWQNYGLFSLKGHAARLGGGEKDFSMLFTYSSVDYYLKDKAKLAFLITQEVFKSKGAGEGFRRFRLGDKDYFKVIKAHDLVTVQPFEKAANKTAMIILTKGSQTSYPIPYTVWSRKKGVGKISTDQVLDNIKLFLQKKNLLAQPMGSPTGSWQTMAETQIHLNVIEGENSYQARQGADTQPYGVFHLEIKQVLSDNDLIVCNLSKEGKFKVHKVEERIESFLVFPALRGADIERWKAIPGFFILMAQDTEKREPFPETQMKREWPRTYGYLLKFKDILLSRSSKSIRDLSERTAFYAMFGIGLYTVARFKVVWKFMSNDMFAAVISQVHTRFGYKTVIPIKTVALFATDNENEAHFLCAAINSIPVREFIKSYSSAGRGFGTPSVMKHVGIPKFDSNNNVHQKLAELSMNLHELKAQNKLEDIENLEKEVDQEVCKLFGIESK